MMGFRGFRVYGPGSCHKSNCLPEKRVSFMRGQGHLHCFEARSISFSALSKGKL